jgi:hypothetical protein
VQKYSFYFKILSLKDFLRGLQLKKERAKCMPNAEQIKKITFSLQFNWKVLILHLKSIGIWCNGNTADSGPAFPGSSPGIPTQSYTFTGGTLR